MSRFAALLLALPLAACGSGGGTNFSISANGEDGNVTIKGGEGRAEVKGPGIEGSIKLPKLQIDAENFDVNGMKLYPGSSIRDFNISANDKSGAKDEGNVTVSFTSPAALDKVQGWFRDKMTERAFKVTQQGSGFAGTTDDDQPLLLELSADGAERTKGTLKIGK